MERVKHSGFETGRFDATKDNENELQPRKGGALPPPVTAGPLRAGITMKKAGVTAASAVVLLLGAALLGAPSALAKHAAHASRHHPRPPGLAQTIAPDWQFVPGRGMHGVPCDLPTSDCPNDERIVN